jgi:hypothetical protein
MTVQDTTSEQIFSGDGITTAFIFTFRADDLGWLDLSFTDDLDVITLNGDQDSNPGGTIDYNVAPPSGQRITINRTVPRTQLLDYQRYDPFDSESHEDALDKLTMMFQDAERTVARKSKSITIESPLVGDDLTYYFTIPAIEVRELNAVIRGSGSVTWTVRYDTDRNAVGTELITGGHPSSDVNGESITIFDNPSIPARSYVWVEVTNVTGQVEALHLSLQFSED